jgi:hypothetical protein
VLIAPYPSSASVEVVIEVDPNDDALETDASRSCVADRCRSDQLVDRAADARSSDGAHCRGMAAVRAFIEAVNGLAL